MSTAPTAAPPLSSRAGAYAFTKLLKKVPHVPFDTLSIKKNFSRIVLVGMGGSSLGIKAVYSALSPHLSLMPVTFLDTSDPIASAERLKEVGQAFFIIVSKSGETLEVLAWVKLLQKKYLTKHNTLFISDNEQSTLLKMAKKNGFSFFLSNPHIPGRFSILSESGLIPLKLIGVPVDELLSGARSLSWQSARNLAEQQLEHARRGKKITVFFTFGEYLRFLGNWYAQLLAESIGKTKHSALTPLLAEGIKDHHSLLQLFLDGPNDKWYFIVRSKHRAHLAASSMQRLFTAQYKGLIDTFKKENKPFFEVALEGEPVKALGSFMFLCELSIAYLGELLKINIENQPAVERLKKNTRKFLLNK